VTAIREHLKKSKEKFGPTTLQYVSIYRIVNSYWGFVQMRMTV